jgi:peptidase A4-like protein
MHRPRPSFRPRALLAAVPVAGLVLMGTVGTASAAHTPANSQTALRLAVQRLLAHWHPTNHTVAVHEVRGLKQLASTNWSGYADDHSKGAVYSSVTGKWTEPKISGCKASTLSAVVFWVGIDGISKVDPTVEQDGTIAVCPGNGSTTPLYGTWWEMFPSTNVTIVGQTVKPGDKIAASVVRSGTKYTLKVTDSTTAGNSFSRTATCAATTCKNQSAEWIAERPEINGSLSTLPKFGTWTLTSATVKAGSKSGTIKSFPDDEITMFNKKGGHVLAKPSALNSAGNSFKDVWKASS